MNGLPLLTTAAVDFIGSSLAIIFIFIALRYAYALVRLQPNNFIWGFLFYFCIAMAAFAISRGVGHIARIILVYSGNGDIWKQLSPFSGGFNTMLMISAAAVTIYYHKGLAAYKAIRGKAEKLAEANTKLEKSAQQLQELNSQLEEMVEERTRNLYKSENKFRNFFENSKDIIYFCDKDGQITNINSSGIELLGINGPAATGNFYELFSSEQDRQHYIDALYKDGFVSDLELEFQDKNGTSHTLLLTANAITDQDGSYIGCEGIGKDMTRLKNITEQLINHEKMASVGQMAAGVAHEINTPLGIILGYTQLMMEDYEEESEELSSLQVIERQTKACRRIVADLLKFSRQAESAKAPVNLNDLVQDVLAVTEHSFNMNQIQVHRNFTENIPRIIADPEKLHQVVIALLNNAQQAMEEGGDITITTEPQDAEVRLSIQDNGTGIPEEIKNKIFDPFFTTKDVGKGTGLGLSVTYGIVQDHGGRIEVESPAPGKTANQHQGTVFHIWFPAVPDSSQPSIQEN